MRALVSLLSLGLCSSCVAHGIRLEQLEKLDGYDARIERRRELRAIDGKPVVFNGSNLTLVTDRQKLKPSLIRLSVRDGVLVGTPAGGPELRLPYAALQRIEVTTFSPRAAGNVVGSILKVAAAAGLVALAAFGITWAVTASGAP